MTVSPASKAKVKPGEPWEPIVAKVLAAVFGGYGLAYTSGAALAKVLPLRPSEAVYLISMLQVPLYVGVIIWIFSVSAKRAWIVLALLIALCQLVVWIN